MNRAILIVSTNA